MKIMRYGAAVLTGIFLLLVLTGCNNFFRELIPSDDNEIAEFELNGQIGGTYINNDVNVINIPWNEGMRLTERQSVSRVSLPVKASLLPLTPEYMLEAFPGLDNHDDLIKTIEGTAPENLTSYMTELIRRDRNFNVPALDKPIDFSGPVTLLVISGYGSVRRYTANVVIYVLFETNGGSAVGAQAVVYETAVSRPNPPSKTGYTFGGWYGDNNTFERPWNFENTVSGNVTLYAKWEAVTYTVRYDKNAADAEGVTGDSIHTYDVDKALTANGYTRREYTFAAWNTAPDGGGTGYVDGQTVRNLSAANGDVVTLYARWNSIYQNTVTFESNGGSGVSPVTGVTGGETISRPVDPSKTGYTFGGWYVDNNTFERPWDFNTSTVTENITLYARWEPITYTVIYDRNASGATGNTADSIHAYDVYKALTANGFAREGYIFTGWNAAPGGGGAAYGDGQAVRNLSSQAGAVVTLYAQWKLIDVSLITVIFNSNGGSNVSPVTGLSAGDRISKPADPARTGHTFGGWYRDNNTFAQPWDFNTNTVTGNITLYAKWTPVTYTVRYDKNAVDAAGTMADSSHTYDVDKALTANGFTRSGYAFAGWNTAADGSGTAYGDGQTVRNLSVQDGALVILYARWNASYTVTYNADGGTPAPASPVIVNYGAVVNQPPAMTKTGYTFDGWYTDAAKTAAAGFPFPVTSNVTLYAKWTQNVYTVTFNSNEGTDISSQTVPYGNKAVEPKPPPSKGSYIFLGWFKANGNQWNFDTDTVTGDITLSAMWKNP